MSTARRMQTAGVLVLVAASLGIAGAGSVLAGMGFQLPEGLSTTVSAAQDALWWSRLGVFLPLAYAVVRVRED
ncbi:MAG: hypothetical protein E6J20_16070 [Chloroflexi bacterium]|nr:MAG: hypothetical protein E6J20_16070 [Chloroflexota bacterium]